MRGVLIAAGLALTVAMAAGPAAAQEGGPLAMLRAADANNDGQLTKAEARAAREAGFNRADANGDGFVTQEERTARRDGAGKRKGRGGGAGGGGGDADGDGKISRAEFMDARYPAFERFDANNNDVLEASELEALRSMAGRRRQGTP